jgi:hypothetical protein
MGRSSSHVRRLIGVRRWGLVVLTCCLALLAVGPIATAQAAGTSSIEGTVTAVKGGTVEGIRVSVSGSGGSGSAFTGPTGKYSIGLLGTGGYSVSFEDPTQKYVSQEQFTSIASEGEAKKLNAELKESGTIKGRVTSAATGSGVPNASVFVSGPNFEFASTDASGFYSVEHLEPGTYTVTFEAAGYTAQTTSVTVGEGVKELNAALTEGGKISGTVTDATTHAGLAKIGVYAFGPAGFGFASTNPNGEYTITGLGTGSYTVLFEWQFSEAEIKEFEKAPRFVPKYISQYFSGQISQATANPVAVTAGATTPGVGAAMVPSAPHNTAVPVISGASAVGSQLSCSSGSWTGEAFLRLSLGWPLTSPFSYQWLRDGAPIAGATTDAYVIQATDVGHGFICEVLAATEAGSASARSAAFTVFAPVPVIKILGTTLKAAKGAIKVGIACANAACKGTVKLAGTVLVKHKGKKKAKKQAVVFATGSYSLAAGKSGSATLRLSSPGKSALAHASHHRATAKLLATVTGGKSVTTSVRLSLGH